MLKYMKHFRKASLYHVSIFFSLLFKIPLIILSLCTIEHRGSGVEMLKPGAKRRRTAA